jgi:hypothetical protein
MLAGIASPARQPCEEHMQRFVADVRHRERDAMPALGVVKPDGSGDWTSYAADVSRRPEHRQTKPNPVP